MLDRRSALPTLLAALTLTLTLTLTACGSDPASGTADTAAVSDAFGGDDVAVDAQDDVALADTAAAGDTAAAADTTTPVSDFTSPGPYGVGYLSDSLTYTPAGDAEPRTLRVVYWYPTRDTDGDDALYAGLLAAPGVFAGAAPADDLGPLPVLLFSHGNGGFAEQSFFFTEFFASHGFLVAAVDHTTNTFFDIQQDSDPRIFRWRPQDITALLDHIADLPAGHALAGLASDRVALSGHSFGGYTTLAIGGADFAVDLVLAYCQTESLPLGACDSVDDEQALYRAGFLDDRVAALVPMSPGAVILFTGGVDDVTVPTLLFTGSKDATTPNATEGDLAWNALAAGANNRRVDFATAGHFTFSDACGLGLGVAEDDGCGAAFVDPDAAHVAIDAYALAFLRLHLLGDTAGASILDGTTPLEDDATLIIGGE